MLTLTTAGAAVVEGPVQVVSCAVTITLPEGSLYPSLTLYPSSSVFPGSVTAQYSDVSLGLSNLHLDAQNTTDLPEGVRTQAGFSNLGGSFTVSGRFDSGLTAAEFFNPDNEDSPLYRLSAKGCAVTVDIGVRPPGQAVDTVRKFTGKVASYGPIDFVSGDVPFQIVDLSGDWDVVPDLPTVVTVPPFNAGLTSEFLIDLIARERSAGAVSSWPAERPGCVLAVGFRSSLWPEVGSIVGSQPTPTYVPGAFGSALTGATATGFYTTPTYTLAAPIDGDDVFAEFWVTNVASASGGGVTVVDGITVGNSGVGGDSLSLSVSGTQIVFGINGGAAEFDVTVSLDDAPHYLAFAAHWPVGSSTCTGNVYVDGTAHPFTKTSPTRSDGFDQLGVGLPIATIEALQVTAEASPTINYPFTPRAVLDPSLNPLDAIPVIDPAAKANDLLQQIASAELGYVRLDEAGVLRFTNRETLINQDSQLTVTSLRTLKQLQTGVGAFTEYNRITADYTEIKFGTTSETVFTLAKPLKVDAHTTQHFTFTLTDTIADIDETFSALADGDSPPTDGNSHFRAATDRAGTTRADYSKFTVTAKIVAANKVKVTVVNNGPTFWFVTAADYLLDDIYGTPALWIGGLTTASVEPVTVEASTDAGDSTFAVPANIFRQDRDTAFDLCTYLLLDLYKARPDYTGVEIIPDPRIQIGDRITLQDPNLTGINTDVLVWGWSLDGDFGDSPQWDMTLNCRALAPPGAWLLDTPGRSELDSTTYLY